MPTKYDLLEANLTLLVLIFTPWLRLRDWQTIVEHYYTVVPRQPNPAPDSDSELLQ